MKDKKLADRLLALRMRFPGTSQSEMAAHFGLGLRQYGRYETGAIPNAMALKKLMARIEHLEKLQSLPPLIYEQSPKNIKDIKTNSVSSTIEELSNENTLLKMKIESLEEVVTSLNLLVKILTDKAGISLETYKSKVPTKTM